MKTEKMKTEKIWLNKKIWKTKKWKWKNEKIWLNKKKMKNMKNIENGESELILEFHITNADVRIKIIMQNSNFDL